MSWRDDALCAEVPGDLWFPEKGEPAWIAKRICGMCPVSEECLEYALRANERYGIYGGLSPKERQELKRNVK